MNRQESYIKRRKVKEENKEWLQETLDHLQGKYFTIQSLRDKLVKEHPELRPVSASTLGRIMKNEIKYSYKKSELSNPRWFTYEMIRSFFESAAILMKLETEGIEVIYIDEFSLSSKKIGFHGWSKRGCKSYLRHFDQSFTMSFVVALYKERIYGIMGKDGTGNSETIKIFLKELWDMRNKREDIKSKPFVICCDNAPVHTSATICKFLMSSELRVITITPYCPALNPWEKLILAIKSKLKSKIAHDKVLNLQLIAQTFDSVEEVRACKYVKASKLEMINQMNKLLMQ